MLFFKKLDREKIEKIKREQSEKTRIEIESHYLDVIRHMRLQHDNDIKKTVSELQYKHDQEISLFAKEKSKEITHLQKIIIKKDERIKGVQQALALFYHYVPRIAHLAEKTKNFKESKVLPYIDEFQEASILSQEWEILERKMQKISGTMSKLICQELN